MSSQRPGPTKLEIGDIQREIAQTQAKIDEFNRAIAGLDSVIADQEGILARKKAAAEGPLSLTEQQSAQVNIAQAKYLLTGQHYSKQLQTVYRLKQELILAELHKQVQLLENPDLQSMSVLLDAPIKELQRKVAKSEKELRKYEIQYREKKEDYDTAQFALETANAMADSPSPPSSEEFFTRHTDFQSTASPEEFKPSTIVNSLLQELDTKVETSQAHLDAQLQSLDSTEDTTQNDRDSLERSASLLKEIERQLLDEELPHELTPTQAHRTAVHHFNLIETLLHSIPAEETESVVIENPAEPLIEINLAARLAALRSNDPAPPVLDETDQALFAALAAEASQELPASEDPASLDEELDQFLGPAPSAEIQRATELLQQGASLSSYLLEHHADTVHDLLLSNDLPLYVLTKYRVFLEANQDVIPLITEPMTQDGRRLKGVFAPTDSVEPEDDDDLMLSIHRKSIPELDTADSIVDSDEEAEEDALEERTDAQFEAELDTGILIDRIKIIESRIQAHQRIEKTQGILINLAQSEQTLNQLSYEALSNLREVIELDLQEFPQEQAEQKELAESVLTQLNRLPPSQESIIATHQDSKRVVVVDIEELREQCQTLLTDPEEQVRIAIGEHYQKFFQHQPGSPGRQQCEQRLLTLATQLQSMIYQPIAESERAQAGRRESRSLIELILQDLSKTDQAQSPEYKKLLLGSTQSSAMELLIPEPEAKVMSSLAGLKTLETEFRNQSPPYKEITLHKLGFHPNAQQITLMEGNPDALKIPLENKIIKETIENKQAYNKKVGKPYAPIYAQIYEAFLEKFEQALEEIRALEESEGNTEKFYHTMLSQLEFMMSALNPSALSTSDYTRLARSRDSIFSEMLAPKKPFQFVQKLATEYACDYCQQLCIKNTPVIAGNISSIQREQYLKYYNHMLRKPDLAIPTGEKLPTLINMKNLFDKLYKDRLVYLKSLKAECDAIKKPGDAEKFLAEHQEALRLMVESLNSDQNTDPPEMRAELAQAIRELKFKPSFTGRLRAITYSAPFKAVNDLLSQLRDAAKPRVSAPSAPYTVTPDAPISHAGAAEAAHLFSPPQFIDMQPPSEEQIRYVRAFTQEERAARDAHLLQQSMERSHLPAAEADESEGVFAQLIETAQAFQATLTGRFKPDADYAAIDAYLSAIEEIFQQIAEGSFTVLDDDIGQTLQNQILFLMTDGLNPRFEAAAPRDALLRITQKKDALLQKLLSHDHPTIQELVNYAAVRYCLINETKIKNPGKTTTEQQQQITYLKYLLRAVQDEVDYKRKQSGHSPQTLVALNPDTTRIISLGLSLTMKKPVGDHLQTLQEQQRILAQYLQNNTVLPQVLPQAAQSLSGSAQREQSAPPATVLRDISYEFTYCFQVADQIQTTDVVIDPIQYLTNLMVVLSPGSDLAPAPEDSLILIIQTGVAINPEQDPDHAVQLQLYALKDQLRQALQSPHVKAKFTTPNALKELGTWMSALQLISIDLQLAQLGAIPFDADPFEVIELHRKIRESIPGLPANEQERIQASLTRAHDQAKATINDRTSAPNQEVIAKLLAALPKIKTHHKAALFLDYYENILTVLLNALKNPDPRILDFEPWMAIAQQINTANIKEHTGVVSFVLSTNEQKTFDKLVSQLKKAAANYEVQWLARQAEAETDQAVFDDSEDQENLAPASAAPSLHESPDPDSLSVDLNPPPAADDVTLSHPSSDPGDSVARPDTLSLTNPTLTPTMHHPLEDVESSPSPASADSDRATTGSPQEQERERDRDEKALAYCENFSKNLKTSSATNRDKMYKFLRCLNHILRLGSSITYEAIDKKIIDQGLTLKIPRNDIELLKLKVGVGQKVMHHLKLHPKLKPQGNLVKCIEKNRQLHMQACHRAQFQKQAQQARPSAAHAESPQPESQTPSFFSFSRWFGSSTKHHSGGDLWP